MILKLYSGEELQVNVFSFYVLYGVCLQMSASILCDQIDGISCTQSM